MELFGFKMERIHYFLGLFSLVYFFEAIGGMYIVSAITNIEKQFQITSKMSGIMVSANDFGYIPAVIFVSYFGSRGNRARWIGCGTVLIAITYFGIASPNFLFPVVAPQANLTEIQHDIQPASELLTGNASLAALLSYRLFQDRLPKQLIDTLLRMENKTMTPAQMTTMMTTTAPIFTRDNAYFTYSIDPTVMAKIVETGQSVVDGTESLDTFRELLNTFISHRRTNAAQDLQQVRRAAIAPFAICGQLVNNLRQKLQEVRCLESPSNLGPFIVLFGSLFVLGIGRTMPWSLGVPLLDDNIKSKNSPAYFAMISFIRILGPICGFLIGSVCNKFYYTLHPPPGLSPADPTWIGAWWIGFAVIGCVTLLPSTFILFFPNPKLTQEEKDNGKTELNFIDKHKAEDEDQSSMEKFKGFIKQYREVLKTKIYRGSVVGRICDILAFKGYMTFLPKYLENHFGIPQYMVHRYMAMFGVFGFALGTMAGGLFVRKFRLTGKQAALMVLIMSTLNTGIFFSKSFIACESVVSRVGSTKKAESYNFTDTCNMDCGCDGAKLYPVCDEDGQAFFSPCHAGCREAKVNKHNSYDAEFLSCDCASTGIVKKSWCQDDCKFATVVFFGTVLLGAFIAGTGVVPGLLILLRSVPPATRSVSLGLQGFMVSLFGTLPSPFIWGIIIDSTCLVWEYTCSGGRGACSLYDSTEMRTRMHFTYTAIRIVSLFTDLYVYVNATGLKIMDEEEKKEDHEVEDVVRRGSVRLREFKEQ
ncbi:unnamed protein product, partial [Mesorhabditis spiculigera]